MIPTSEKSIEIREIRTVAEMRSVEEMQKEVWGVPDIEVVPASHLTAAVAAGGVLIGAFDGDRLVGFVYGFPSFERGQTAHHSHMLAVKPEYRSHKLGEKLKHAQREFVARQGIKTISWTFDPLQSLNAYFNFNKLGVVSDTYFVDFYGDDAPSFLHQNGTDRLWVMWDLNAEPGHKSGAIDLENIKTLVSTTDDGGLRSIDIEKSFDGERLAIEIPPDITYLEQQNIELAREWRLATRAAFTKAFANGYTATAFYRMQRDGRDYGVYILEQK